MITTIDKYQVRTDLIYDPDNHFWLDINDQMATVGMSPLIQETNGSFVAVQLLPEGTTLHKNDSFGSAEAEKHVGPLQIPVSGEIIETNHKVINNPRLINTSPYQEGWLIKVRLLNFEEEKNALVSGEEEITTWFKSELKKFDEKGWLAQ